MRKKRRQFYVPNTDLWRWERLTDTFLKVQLERVRNSYNETENALSVLDEEVIGLGRLARQWQHGSGIDLKTIIELRYKEISQERKRILNVQERIVQELDRMRTELNIRKRNSDRKLPA